MSEWIDFDRWHECMAMARPGIVFEIANADGQRLFTPCVLPLPPVPFDWKSPPLQFRAVAEPPAERSAPLPEPKSEP